MNELERIQAREAYFEQYRKKVDELDETVKQHERVSEEFNQMMEDCIEQRNYLKRELDAMRNIITYMLDHGLDPVEAKLTLDHDNKKDHLWKTDGFDREMYGSLSVNTATGTIGAIGATGAAGTGYINVTSSAFKSNYNLRP